MKLITIKGHRFVTNITDYNLLNKCIEFLSDGCSSYAISFSNKEKDIIKTTNIEGFKANYLRNMNFDKCFLPERAKDITEARKVLQKGLDLIELL
jgi:hypothetical protein